MNLDSWLLTRNCWANLEHVSAEHHGRTWAEVVGVVLHERGATAGRGHALQNRTKGTGLPVSLASETIAVGHKPLNCKAWQLPELAKVFEVARESVKVARLKNRAQRDFDFGPVDQRIVASATLAQLGNHVVFALVNLAESLCRRIADVCDCLDQGVDAELLDRHSELHLGRNLVSVGNRDVAHVVAKAGQLEILRRVPADCRIGPGGNP